MTDFITTITDGQFASSFANQFWANVPATVPSGDRYICEIGTEDLNENLLMDQRIINGVIIVRPVSGQEHDGTRNSGIQVGRGSGVNDNLMTHDCTGSGQIIVEDLEVRFGSSSNVNNRIFSPEPTNTPLAIVRRCLITNVNTVSTRPLAMEATAEGDVHFISNRFWDQSGNSGVRLYQASMGATTPAARVLVIQGNVFQVIGGAIARGVNVEMASTTPAGSRVDVQGNMVFGSPEDYRVQDLGATGSTFIFAQNTSEDATGQVTGATVANDLVSTDNPDVKAGSIALEVWTNEPTAFGAELDIRGFNRTVVAQAADWDSGSMQFSTEALPPSEAAGNITRPVAFSNIFDIIRGVAPDITFP